jgi:hypothetical protein
MKFSVYHIDTYLNEFKCSNVELGLLKKITYSPLDPLLPRERKGKAAGG